MGLVKVAEAWDHSVFRKSEFEKNDLAQAIDYRISRQILSSSMAVAAEIKTGKRRVIQYCYRRFLHDLMKRGGRGEEISRG